MKAIFVHWWYEGYFCSLAVWLWRLFFAAHRWLWEVWQHSLQSDSRATVTCKRSGWIWQDIIGTSCKNNMYIYIYVNNNDNINSFCSVRFGIMVCAHISHSVYPNWTLPTMSLASHCTPPAQWGGWDAKIQELISFSGCCKAPGGTGRVERGRSRA